MDTPEKYLPKTKKLSPIAPYYPVTTGVTIDKISEAERSEDPVLSEKAIGFLRNYLKELEDPKVREEKGPILLKLIEDEARKYGLLKKAAGVDQIGENTSNQAAGKDLESRVQAGDGANTGAPVPASAQEPAKEKGYFAKKWGAVVSWYNFRFKAKSESQGTQYGVMVKINNYRKTQPIKTALAGILIAGTIAGAGYFAYHNKGANHTTVTGSEPSSKASKDALAALYDKNTKTIEYIVKPGDTLWKIGKHLYNRDPLQIARDNGLANPNLIRPGQKLIINPAPSRPPPPTMNEVVTASWYGPAYHNKLTASGQRFDMHKNTLAHRTLPLGTKVRLVNPANGKSAEGVVNDRGPYIKGRDVDVSYAMAKQLGFVKKGVAKLDIQAI